MVYGPFSSQEIASWKSQGFFTGSSAVLMRKVPPASKSSSIYDDEPSPSPAASASNEQGDDWVSSDSIDFGSYVNLDKESLDVRLGPEKIAKASKVKFAEMGADGGTQRSRQGVRRKRGDDDNDDGDNDDEEGDDEEEDGIGGGRGKRRRRKGLRLDADADDDEDD